jgi:hypothetical protein
MAITTIVFDFGNVIGFFDHRRAARKLAEDYFSTEKVLPPLLQAAMS